MHPSYQRTQHYPSAQVPSQQMYQQPNVAQQPQLAQQPVQQQPIQQQPVQQQPFQQQPLQQQPVSQQPFQQQPIQQQSPMSQQGQMPVQTQPSIQQFEPGQFVGQSWPGHTQRLPLAQSLPSQQSVWQPAPQEFSQAGFVTQPGLQAMSQPMYSPSAQPRAESAQFAAGQTQQSGFGQGMGQQSLVHGQELPASSPLIDILDSSEEITLLADLPGFTKEDIQLQASGNTLQITAIRSEEMDDEERPLQRERLPRFERTITLPVQIDVEQAEASFEDGVCRITLPKSEEMIEKSIAFQ